jgi:succinoglycan biosynthesis protein ExoM
VIDVSICICTFRRPQALLRLLRSLQRLDPASPGHEVIVVDNDAEKTAEATIEQARAEGMELQYLVEPVRGIARARNRSIEPATGEFVAFIDDDEEADPKWLLRLWAEVKRHQDDGGIGPVLPKFDHGTPPWLIRGRFFERPRHPTGTILAAGQTRTGNALVRRALLAASPGPFDEAYGLTGGEDTELFLRLIAADGRFIAVDSAIVYEHLPRHRTTVRWLLRRRFLAGMAAARLYVATVPVEARRRWQRARPLIYGLAWALGGLALFPASRIHGLNGMARAARAFGVFAFHSGFSFRPYLSDDWR